MPSILAVEFAMTQAQIATLETFLYTTIKGVYRFYFPHPRTGALVEVRVIPSEDGGLYTSAHKGFQGGNNVWAVSMALEILP
jgi:hypothetical protein